MSTQYGNERRERALRDRFADLVQTLASLTSDVSLRCSEPTRWAAIRHDIYHFRFASGLATARAQSMKSRATGLSVRFFRVTIPFGRRAIGSSTGKALISERLVGNLNAEAGKIVTKRPVAKRLTRIWGASVTTVTRG